MESLGRPSEMPPSETLYEHLELSHYIDTFRVSAERVRRLVFIIAVFSVVMATALWNSTPTSWMGGRRLDHYKELRKLTPAQLETHGGLNRAELESRISEYSRLRTEKVLLPQIPVVGVVFDINDLGNFCGLAYFLLLALLFFSVMREHEHLYLALFKVRRLHDEKRGGTGGESRANYLYHALAMSQVLCMPPTLAQWKPSRLQKLAVPYIIFTFPIVVELAIFVFDWSTASVIRAHPSIMIPESIFIVLNLACCFMCYRYSLDFNHMWAGAFRHINPSSEYVERRPLLRVFHLRHPSVRGHTERRLRAQAVSALDVDTRPDTLLPLANQVFIAEKVISNTEIERMCTELERQAEAVGTIVDCKVNLSRLSLAPEDSRERNSWEVQAEFMLRAAVPPRRRQAWLTTLRFRRTAALSLAQDDESLGGPTRPDAGA